VGAFNGSTLYYYGLRNRQATVAALRASFGFGAATETVVGGGSAGGIAAYLHADYYASEAAPGAKGFAMPDSGFFEDGNNNRDGKGDCAGLARSRAGGAAPPPYIAPLKNPPGRNRRHKHPKPLQLYELLGGHF